MATFGDLERAFADLYPYRWYVLLAALALIAALTAFGWRQGWHHTLWRYRKPLGIAAVPLLAVSLWLGWSLGSPLFTNVTVDEEFPFAGNAVVPAGMERTGVEQVMAGVALLDDPVMETMPAAAAMDAEMALNAVVANGPGPAGQVVVLAASELDALAEAMAESLTEAMPEALAEAMPEALAEAITDGDGPLRPAGMLDEIQEMAATLLPPMMQPSDAQPRRLATGNFQDADAFHRGSGTATIYAAPGGARLLRLEELEVTNGPRLHVILSPHPAPERSEEVLQPGYIDLGRLKGNRGNQNYPLPAGADLEPVQSVVIYCKPFAVVFSVAALQ